jgi:glycosyltransferase involved in cell wall biosynthesis
MRGRSGQAAVGDGAQSRECGLKILLSSASFALEYGGPAYSVRALANHLVRCGLDVAIWAPDGSAPKVDAPADASGGALALQGTLSEALSVFGAPDLFHDSGLWWRHNRAVASTARRISRPVVVSTRGMLEPAALHHRAWRKRIAWHAYQRRHLERAAAIHVTGELEGENIRALGLGTKIVRIPNGVSVPERCPFRAPSNSKRMTFLGRLHPIKGLPLLIEAWGRIRPTDWILEVAGPDEGGHRRALEDQVTALALQGAVTFTGPADDSGKRALLARTTVLALPSYSESFGVVVGEALGDGIPVIATHGTPWAALETTGSGWHVPGSVDGLEYGLRNVFATPTQELIAMGQRGHAYVVRTFSWPGVAKEMADLYQSITDAGAGVQS